MKKTLRSVALLAVDQRSGRSWMGAFLSSRSARLSFLKYFQFPDNQMATKHKPYRLEISSTSTTPWQLETPQLAAIKNSCFDSKSSFDGKSEMHTLPRFPRTPAFGFPEQGGT